MVGIRLEEFKQALLEVPIMQDVAKEWEEKGRDKEKKEITRSMLAKGMDARIIAEITGLNIDEIAKIKLE